MQIGWILGGIFIFVTLIFIAIAVFLPEWVGITGKKALETMKEQQGEHFPQEPKKDSQTSQPS